MESRGTGARVFIKSEGTRAARRDTDETTPGGRGRHGHQNCWPANSDLGWATGATDTLSGVQSLARSLRGANGMPSNGWALFATGPHWVLSLMPTRPTHTLTLSPQTPALSTSRSTCQTRIACYLLSLPSARHQWYCSYLCIPLAHTPQHSPAHNGRPTHLSDTIQVYRSPRSPAIHSPLGTPSLTFLPP